MTKSIQILMADDDEDDRFFFKEALTASGVPAELMTVEDGQELMDFLADIDSPPPPHMIFLDINMPYKNGRACLREIRSNKKFDRTPVIMFSTSDHEVDVEDSFEQGANMYIPKYPFFMNDVKAMKKVYSSYLENEFTNRSREKFIFKIEKE